MKPSAALPALAAAMIIGSFASPTLAAGDLKVTQHIAGPDGGWDYASFDPARRRVYIAHGTEVMTIDADTGKVNPTFAAGDHLHEVLAVPGADLVVTTNSGDHSVRILNAADGSLVKSIDVADDPDGAAYDPSTGYVVVVNGDPGLLTLIDPRKGEVAGTITVGDKLEFVAVDGEGRAFVNVEDKGQVALVDLKKRQATARWTMADCKRPTGLAYVAGDRVISSCNSGWAKILDAATGKEIAQVKIGGFADSVLYDPKRAMAYVPTALDGQMTEIALSGPHNNAAIGDAPSQVGARTGAVDPKTGRVYLPTAQFELPATPGKRPAPKPGTFEVLVLDR